MPLNLPKISVSPPKDTFTAFQEILRSMDTSRQQQATTKKINIQNENLRQQQSLQNQQMQGRIDYQDLVNKYYPMMAQARSQSTSAAGMPQLMRAYQAYLNYRNTYGENNPITQEAFSSYNLLKDQVGSLNKWHNMQTENNPFKSLTAEGKNATQNYILGKGGILPIPQENPSNPTGIVNDGKFGTVNMNDLNIPQNKYDKLRQAINSVRNQGNNVFTEFGTFIEE